MDKVMDEETVLQRISEVLYHMSETLDLLVDYLTEEDDSIYGEEDIAETEYCEKPEKSAEKVSVPENVAAVPASVPAPVHVVLAYPGEVMKVSTLNDVMKYLFGRPDTDAELCAVPIGNDMQLLFREADAWETTDRLYLHGPAVAVHMDPETGSISDITREEAGEACLYLSAHCRAAMKKTGEKSFVFSIEKK